MHVSDVILGEDYAIGHHNWERRPKNWHKIKRATALSLVREPGTDFSPPYRTVRMRFSDGTTDTVQCGHVRMPWDDWVQYQVDQEKLLGLKRKPKHRAKVPQFDRRLREAIEDYIEEVQPTAKPIFDMEAGSVTLPITVLYDILLEAA